MRVIVEVVVATVGLLILFKLLSWISKKRNRRTPSYLADLLERHILGADDRWEWDDFISTPFANKELERLRVQCTELGQYPLSNSQIQQLRDWVSVLRPK